MIKAVGVTNSNKSITIHHIAVVTTAFTASAF